MSVLLFGIGAVAVVVGVVMVGFGIPVNEFSFGNTLIGGGVTAAVGGLIVIGLGAAVAQLQRINEALATRTPIRSSRPLVMVEPAASARAAAGRIPFPPRPRSDSGSREPYLPEARMGGSEAADMPAEEYSAQAVAPVLRNPDEPPVTVEDEVSLSPGHPMAAGTSGSAGIDAPAPLEPPPGFNPSEMAEGRQESAFDAGWPPPLPPAVPAAEAQPRRPHTAYFDAMWPAAESKPAKSAADSQASSEPKFDPLEREDAGAPAEPEAPIPRPEHEPRAAAILKSGVVDGMGYTLYVDGSIEAELPQGTLRFASINELRSHLENNA